MNGGKKIVLTRIEQRIVGQRAGRDDPRYLPFDQPFRQRRVFHLLADCRAKSRLNQPPQVVVELMIREPGHRDRVGGPFVAAGERQPQRAGRLLGIFVKQLVEVADAKQQNGTGILRLHFQVALHRRGGSTVVR
jgi:hypothetical protein